MRVDAECAFFLSIHLLFRNYSMVTPSVWIRLNLPYSRSGQREQRCSVRNLAGLLVDILLGMCDLFSRDKLVLRLQNQLYRLSSVRDDLHIAECFESIFAEFNANP
jgi:hypothetical protein